MIVKEGQGEGCDYTIGCNVNYCIEEFDGDIHAAKKHFLYEQAYPDGEDEYFTLAKDYDGVLNTMYVIPFDERFEVDFQDIRLEYKAKQQQRARKKIEREDLKELERLKKKYNK